MTRLALVLLLVLGCGFVHADEGGNTGGGGTVVQTPNSKSLVFWDLYAYDQNFSDNTPGDRLALRPKNQPRTGAVGDWIDFRDLKSFNLLRDRLNRWRYRAPELFAAITENGVMMKDDGCRWHDSYVDCQTYTGWQFMIAGTPLYIQSLDEIDVPTSIDISGIRAFPAAYFLPGSQRILLNFRFWNAASLYSQAALLLHERLRFVQLTYKISNAQLQYIVYNIITRNPEDVPQSEFDDTMFTSPNVRGSVIDPKLNTEMAKIHIETGLNCLKFAPDPRDCMLDKQYDQAGKPPRVTDLGDLTVADKAVAEAASDGVLATTPKPLALKSQGKNWRPLVKNNPPPTPSAGVVMDQNNCAAVVRENGKNLPYNTYRWPLECNGRMMTGTGGLYFESPMSDEFNVEIKGSLYSNNDGGSEFDLTAFGITVDLHNEGPLIMSIGNETLRGTESDMNGDEVKRLHAWVVRYLFAQRRVELVLNDDGNFRNSKPLMAWDMPASVPKDVTTISWTYRSDNNVNVKSIKLLSQSGRDGGLSSPFENWEVANASGINYISRSNQSCKPYYDSVFEDPLSKRRECVPVANYTIQPGTKCAAGFFAQQVTPERLACMNSKYYTEYYPIDGQECHHGYTYVGRFHNGNFDGRVCVDISRSNGYNIYKEVHLTCAPGFRSAKMSFGGDDWVRCDRISPLPSPY